MSTRLLLFPALIATCALLLAACGSSNRLEGGAMRKIENDIKQKLEQRNKGLHVLYARCPKSVRRKKGVVFTCHVKGQSRARKRTPLSRRLTTGAQCTTWCRLDSGELRGAVVRLFWTLTRTLGPVESAPA